MNGPPRPRMDAANAALLTDLYELTMAQAYLAEGMREPAVFDLMVRRLPDSRNVLLACGLDDALAHLEALAFPPEAIESLRLLELFSEDFLGYLRSFRFTGDVHAVPEGTPVFAGEPILEVVAPLPEAQLAETFLLNQVTFQTMVASKALRVVRAAAGRTVVDFGLRRAHGTDAGIKAARAAYVAGVHATSNVLAGRCYGIPVRGTMAHSYIQAHEDELAAFRAFASRYPEAVLLVDTYDTLEGVRNVIRLARELGADFKIRAIRLDSGDLLVLAREARRMLDAAGLSRVGVFASGSLDESGIAGLVGAGAPVSGFGVGTRMDVSADAPSLDTAYKLVSYAGHPRMKLSSDKTTLPGRKQVVRVVRGGVAERDVIGLHGERLEGEPLLATVMAGGRRTAEGAGSVDAARARAARELAGLPERIQDLGRAEPPYPVEVSPGLCTQTERLRASLEGSVSRD
ncbi:MAG TPA: nicotinate phosphoribosyltransferase [bacterium]